QNYKAAVSKLEFSKSLFETATASYELAFAGYKAGVGSILDLLQAQNKFSDAVSKLIQSKQDVFVAFAELTHATGALSAARQDGNTGKQDIAAREQ
ncbi:MAG: TolC family protein, partial [Candidatus Omnitrophota bacterium]